MRIDQGTMADIPWVLGELRKFSQFMDTSKPIFGDDAHVTGLIVSLIEEHVLLIARNETEPMGLIAGVLVRHPFNPELSLLAEQAWWVSEKYRGSRAGLTLLDAFLDHGKQVADWVTVSTIAHSPISEKHLTKRGLKLQERSYLLEAP